MDLDRPVTKRLHISGLPSSLSTEGLSKRLSVFGTVKALDGFGLVNGVGLPRTFGYITIETTGSRLAKCLNVLSGSIWKGAKLRIGEARPDYAERFARERENSEFKLPKKKRRLGRACGIEAPDMSLVTPANVSGRGHWKVTPMGRLVRPIRIRPDRPLVDAAELERVRAIKMSTLNGKEGGEGKVEQKKSRKRVKCPLTRARRQKIDPTRWGSTHLKGLLLDTVEPPAKKDPTNEGPAYRDETEESEESEVEEQPSTKQQSKLKDLFAPREQAGFSLLEQLDPDLDDEAMIPSFSRGQSPSVTHQNAYSTSTSSYIPTSLAPSRAARLEFDPLQPLFFPFLSSTSASVKGRTKDLFDVARSSGWDWRDPSVGFYRTGTEEDIRGKWEKEKLALTREWKKRSREAEKMRKRRGGVDGD